MNSFPIFYFGKKIHPNIAMCTTIAAITIAGLIFPFTFSLPSLSAYAEKQQSPQNATDKTAGTTASIATTIRVIGESSIAVKPDQVTIIINAQTQPGELASVLTKQQAENDRIIRAVQQAVGENSISNNETKIVIGTRNINPQYSPNSAIQSSKNITFSVYATVGISTDIDHLADLVNRLSDSGFGFQSVSINPAFTTALAREAAISYGGGVAIGGGAIPGPGSVIQQTQGQYQLPPSSSNNNNTNRTAESNATSPIILGVSLNTTPNTLNKVISEYTQKYKELLDVLREAGVSANQVQQTNLNINPIYYTPPIQNVTYSSNTLIYVSTSTVNLEKVVNEAQIAGGNVQNFYLSVSDSTIDKARKALYQKAVENATTRAREIVEPLGLEVKGINSIDATTAAEQAQSPYVGGGTPIFYRGLHIIQQFNPPPNTTELSASIIVEFGLCTPEHLTCS